MKRDLMRHEGRFHFNLVSGHVVTYDVPTEFSFLTVNQAGHVSVSASVVVGLARIGVSVATSLHVCGVRVRVRVRVCHSPKHLGMPTDQNPLRPLSQMVPTYRPQEALAMLKRFINGSGY